MHSIKRLFHKRRVLHLFFTLSIVFLVNPVNGAQDIEQLIEKGGFLLIKEHGEKIGFNENKTFTPASTVKILTALAALETIDEDFRFTTRFYYDQNKNLYIQGGGDPFLVSEEIEVICEKLRLAGITEVASIILDDSLYQLTGPADGAEATLQPYDAHNSALAVNFNTVHIKVQKDGSVISAEDQTPTTPFLKHFNFLPAGRHRININQLTGLTIPPHLQYAGELFGEFLKINFITIASPEIAVGKPPATLEPVLEWQSDYVLSELISMFLLSSSNFMANQVFLQFGLQKKGAPATWQKARESIHEFILNRLEIPSASIHIEEGSGLSRKTYMSPEAMIHILEHFKPHYQLLSFSKKYKLYRKTGTLKKVHCLAGYIPKNEELLPFAIFLNQKKNKRYEILKQLISEASK